MLKFWKLVFFGLTVEILQETLNTINSKKKISSKLDEKLYIPSKYAKCSNLGTFKTYFRNKIARCLNAPSITHKDEHVANITFVISCTTEDLRQYSHIYVQQNVQGSTPFRCKTEGSRQNSLYNYMLYNWSIIVST